MTEAAEAANSDTAESIFGQKSGPALATQQTGDDGLVMCRCFNQIFPLYSSFVVINFPNNS